MTAEQPKPEKKDYGRQTIGLIAFATSMALGGIAGLAVDYMAASVGEELDAREAAQKEAAAEIKAMTPKKKPTDVSTAAVVGLKGKRGHD